MHIASSRNIKARRAQNGFIVSELIAMGIILFSVAGIAAVTKAGFDTFRRYEVQSFMIERETYIVNGLQTQSVLNSLRDQLKNGALPQGTPIMLDNQLIARNNTTLEFDATKNALCSSNPCHYKVSVSFNIQCVTTPSDGNRCNAAYVIWSDENKTVYRSGPSQSSMAIASSDYLIPIPFELAERDFVDSCNSTTEMFASGFDKVSGQMRCVAKPLLQCQPNQIATGMSYRSTGNMELDCQSLRMIGCPADYVLQSIEPASLDPRSSGGVRGRCVLASQRSVPFLNPPPPASSIGGVFCPRLYSVSGLSCPLVNEQSSPGTCYYDCSTTDSKGNIIPQTCSYQVPANRGSVEISVSGRSLSCTVIIPAQSCGASWSAQTQASGSCVADVPETVNAL